MLKGTTMNKHSNILRLLIFKHLMIKRQSDNEFGGFRAYQKDTTASKTSASFIPLEIIL